ncbi:MAG: YgiQ family radical SAM protein, partial [Candidatus Methanoplasma sp.]|nr:YgiQ family radical SAM protein [Candidatus Methanoplasma sp.]
MFIPTTPEEVNKRGWKALDVIIVSGDTYIDSSYNGAAVIGHWLIDNGFRVGIVCQPDIDSDKDITRLGEPGLFWSVTAGAVDSMVANYTPTNKFRKDDDFTPGGINDRRPDRACIAYTNVIKKYIKGKPVVLGGIEASLRRIAHYDAWSDSVRRSILFDSKADLITYGMAELSNLELAQRMRDGKDISDVRGICRIGKEPPSGGYIGMPAYEKCAE